MTPTTWLDVVLWWLWWPWLKTQCCAELPVHSGVAYCIRRKGHPGQHETSDGESFPTSTRRD